MNVEGLARRAGQQRPQARFARRDRGRVLALGGERFPDLLGPEGVKLVALAGFVDRVAGQCGGVGEAAFIEGVCRERIGRCRVVRPAAGADRVADDGIVHKRPRSASDRLPSHALS